MLPGQMKCLRHHHQKPTIVEKLEPHVHTDEKASYQIVLFDGQDDVESFSGHLGLDDGQ